MEWQKQGKVSEVKQPPLVINPMSVVEKWDFEKGENKLRPVIDMSRYIIYKSIIGSFSYKT